MTTFIPLSPDFMPRRSTTGSAAYDCYAAEDATIPQFTVVPVRLGFSISDMPQDVAALLLPRSGLSLKGLTLMNAPGLIDSDFRDELKAILYYAGATSPFERAEVVSNSFIPFTTPVTTHRDNFFKVKKGDRICQLLLINHLSSANGSVASETRTGGFGSTGVSS